MQVTETHFLTDDDFDIAGTVYEPGEGPQRLVVVNAAMAVRRRYYDKFARFLCQRGALVVTYDYRGIGDSRPPSLKGFKAQVTDWGRYDQQAVLAWCDRRYPGFAPRVVAHSVGGQIVPFAQHADRVEKVLGIAAQSGDWRRWPMPERIPLMVAWYFLLPAVAHLFGYVPGRLGLGEDVPKDVVLQWARWGRTRGYLVGDDPSRKELFARVTAEVRGLSISDDRFYAPPSAVQALLDFYSNSYIQHLRVEKKPVGHFGFFRPSNVDLWESAADWLER